MIERHLFTYEKLDKIITQKYKSTNILKLLKIASYANKNLNVLIGSYKNDLFRYLFFIHLFHICNGNILYLVSQYLVTKRMIDGLTYILVLDVYLLILYMLMISE